MGVLFGIACYRDSDTSKLVKDWMSAKTEGICPLVEFVADEEKDQT
jgi:hypothetical protein